MWIRRATSPQNFCYQMGLLDQDHIRIAVTLRCEAWLVFSCSCRTLWWHVGIFLLSRTNLECLLRLPNSLAHIHNRTSSLTKPLKCGRPRKNKVASHSIKCGTASKSMQPFISSTATRKYLAVASIETQGQLGHIFLSEYRTTPNTKVFNQIQVKSHAGVGFCPRFADRPTPLNHSITNNNNNYNNNILLLTCQNNAPCRNVAPRTRLGWRVNWVTRVSEPPKPVPPKKSNKSIRDFICYAWNQCVGVVCEWHWSRATWGEGLLWPWALALDSWFVMRVLGLQNYNSLWLHQCYTEIWRHVYRPNYNFHSNVWIMEHVWVTGHVVIVTKKYPFVASTLSPIFPF